MILLLHYATVRSTVTMSLRPVVGKVFPDRAFRMAVSRGFW